MNEVRGHAARLEKELGAVLDEEHALLDIPVTIETFEIGKDCPIISGCGDYFPNALAAIAAHSKYGNDKHNPGEPLHWAFDKSTQHADSAGRHLVKRGTIDPETGKSHTIGFAWRALACLETELVNAGAPPGRAVRRGTL